MNDPNNNVIYSDIEAQKQSEETPLLPKGQLISEDFFLSSDTYFKKQTIFLHISTLAFRNGWIKKYDKDTLLS